MHELHRVSRPSSGRFGIVVEVEGLLAGWRCCRLWRLLVAAPTVLLQLELLPPKLPPPPLVPLVLRLLLLLLLLDPPSKGPRKNDSFAGCLCSP